MISLRSSGWIPEGRKLRHLSGTEQFIPPLRLFQATRDCVGQVGNVGRTPSSASDPPVRLFPRFEQADQGVGCGPGGPPHNMLAGVASL
jgi:hypothetical protein